LRLSTSSIISLMRLSFCTAKFIVPIENRQIGRTKDVNDQ
jgi:hypothetical protein